MSTDWRKDPVFHALLLTALCGVLFFANLGRAPFFDKGEPREALAVQDIVLRGEWLLPLKTGSAIPSKPPLFHWFAALASHIAGEVSEFTVRLPSAVFATLGVLLVYALGSRLFNAQTALLGGAILASTLVYQGQATTARVDMTLCFVVTLSLAFFYALYRGLLTRRIWYYAFYGLLGIGVLAKGPVSVILVGLTAGLFLVFKRRWDVLLRFCFHEGIALTVVLAAGWYWIALSRGGEGFLSRQILHENIARFFGGSGHSHAVYYYVPYLFVEGLPWSLFLPLMIVDWFREEFLTDENSLFLKLWVLVVFVFFSLSMGKRPVYLLPLYPALALLAAAWFNQSRPMDGLRLAIFRLLAVGFCLEGLLLLAISVGGLWTQQLGWFLHLVAPVLGPNDRGRLLVVQDVLAQSGWLWTVLLLLSSFVWILLAQRLWWCRVRALPAGLLLVCVFSGAFMKIVIMPGIADSRSYRSFMNAVNQRVDSGDRLYLYGDSFNTDSLFLYRAGPIPALNQPLEVVAEKIGSGDGYVITGEEDWRKAKRLNPNVGLPILKSKGTGPDGNDSLVLLRAKIP